MKVFLLLLFLWCLGSTSSSASAFTTEETEVGERKEAEEMDDDVSYTCQFCGKYDPSFTDEKLDMHYWQSCPLLMSCEECGQVRPRECRAWVSGVSSARQR